MAAASLIGDAAAATRAAFAGLLRYDHRPEVAIASIVTGTPVDMVGISTPARSDLAMRQRERRRFPGKEQGASKLKRCLTAIRAGNDFDRVKRVHDAVHLHWTPRQLHFRLYALAEDPG